MVYLVDLNSLKGKVSKNGVEFSNSEELNVLLKKAKVFGSMIPIGCSCHLNFRMRARHPDTSGRARPWWAHLHGGAGAYI